MVVPLVILGSIDPVMRDSAIFAMLSDVPGTGVLLQDLDCGGGTMRRVISDENGIIEDRTAPLEHTCLGCAIREDSLPSLEAMAASGRWRRILWALPVSAHTAPAARPLLVRPAAGAGLDLVGVVSAVATDCVEHDLLDDDLLDERGLALSLDDRRSVGEALAAQLRHADLVLTTGSEPVGTGLVDKLRGRGSQRADLFASSGADAFRRRYVHLRSESRLDPRRVSSGSAPDDSPVWSLELRDRRPFHPGRLLDRIEDLGSGRLVSYGCFHLPTRPGRLAQWDGAGGQVSLGDAGTWGRTRPLTRLQIIGTGDERGRIRAAFTDAILSNAELRMPSQHWRVEDGLDTWLGTRDAAA
jgi:G3E family GTPase